MFKIILVFIAVLRYTNCAKILAIIPLPSRSHHIAFFELWKELSLRGHHLTLVTTDPLYDSQLTNLTEIDLSEGYQHIKMISHIIQAETNQWNRHNAVRIILKDVVKYTFSHHRIQQLAQGKDKYDLVMVEHLFPELLIFGRIYDCPTIVLSSTDVDQIFYQFTGNPTHPVSHPHFYLPYYGTLNFWERLWSTYHYLYTWYHFKFNNGPYYEGNLRQYFNTSTSIKELLNEIDLLMINSHPVIHGPRALGPATVLMNYQRGPPTSKKTVKISKDLNQFMDNAKDGFIYFSLGSYLKGTELNKDILKNIIEVLGALPIPTLYKYEDSALLEKPDNVKIIEWAPQRHILNHPNIKVFVTQGGRQSTEEAVYAAVPMVVIPFFYDQDQNGNALKARGVAQTVHRSMQKNELSNAIMEVISNPRYAEAAKRLRKLALDVPMNGLEQAIWWTEYVIRNKGAKQLRNPAVDLPLYQYLLLDVIGFLVSLLVATIAFIYFLVKQILKKFEPHVKSSKKKE